LSHGVKKQMHTPPPKKKKKNKNKNKTKQKVKILQSYRRCNEQNIEEGL
jgi:hypothetical protein